MTVPVNSPVAQHGVSAVAIVAAPVSFWAHAPETVTIVVGSLGIIWYVMIITEKILSWVKRKKPETPEVPDRPEIHRHN